MIKGKNEMTEKRRYRCSCGYEFLVIYDRTASNPGMVFRDLGGRTLPEIKICKCGKKFSLEPRGYNPLNLEK
jgi:hypothetical protein